MRQGGHSVPEDAIRRRFALGLSNFFSLFQPIADSWQLFDNAVAGPRPIAFKKAGGEIEICDAEMWDTLVEIYDEHHR